MQKQNLCLSPVLDFEAHLNTRQFSRPLVGDFKSASLLRHNQYHCCVGERVQKCFFHTSNYTQQWGRCVHYIIHQGTAVKRPLDFKGISRPSHKQDRMKPKRMTSHTTVSSIRARPSKHIKRIQTSDSCSAFSLPSSGPVIYGIWSIKSTEATEGNMTLNQCIKSNYTRAVNLKPLSFWDCVSSGNTIQSPKIFFVISFVPWYPV